MRAIRPVTVAAVATSLLSLAAVVVGAPPGAAGSGPRHGSGGGEHPDRGVLEEVVPLDGPRGLDLDRHHRRILVTETDGSISVVHRRHGETEVTQVGQVPGGFAPAAVFGSHGSIWAVSGAGDGPGASTLYHWLPGRSEPRAVVDLAAYQEEHPDPDDLEGDAGESNPFGLAALDHHRVLVADAAGNELLEVDRRGHVRSVARFLPRVVEVPEGLPATGPGGEPLPPAGTEIPSESVPTSVVVGADGDYYVSELRGFPATPGTSQVWRVDDDARRAVCDPAKPRQRDCHRVADGLTSVVDLAVDGKDLYAVTLSKLSWLALELGVPVAEEGAVYRLRPGHHRGHPKEIAPGQVRLPGGVEVDRHRLWLTGPVFGPGSLSRLDLHGHHHHPDRPGRG